MTDVMFLDTQWDDLLCMMLLKTSKKNSRTKAKIATIQGAGLLAFCFWVHNNSVCKSTASAKYYNNHTNHLFAQKIDIFYIGYAMT